MRASACRCLLQASAPSPAWVTIDFEREIVLQGKLGQGAFGTVYRALWGERRVAVKLVPLLEEDSATVCTASLESLKQEVQVGAISMRRADSMRTTRGHHMDTYISAPAACY